MLQILKRVFPHHARMDQITERLSDADMEAAAAALHDGYPGRVLALTRFLAISPRGTEVHYTVKRPLLARVRDADGPPIRWTQNGQCGHVFPITALAPHPSLRDDVPAYGFGRAVDRYGYLVGEDPKSGPAHLRLRRLKP
jgi:hypothetical protein